MYVRKGPFTYDVSALGGEGGLVKCWQNLTWGGGGVWPMMMSAKKDILLQLHKQDYSTFEFEFEIDFFKVL